MEVLGTRNHSIWHLPEDDNVEESPVVYHCQWEKKIKPVKSFSHLNLSPSLVNSLRASSILFPNEIEAYLLSLLIIENKDKDDIIMHAKNDSGKTTSILIMLLHKLFSKVIMVYAKIDSAKAAYDVAVKFCKGMNLSFSLVTGNKSNHSIAENIIIGTPLKIANLIEKKLIKSDEVQLIVVEEMKIMLNNRGHKDALIQIFKIAAKNCQLILSYSDSSYEPLSDTNTIRTILESDVTDLKKIIPKQYFTPICIKFPINSPCNNFQYNINVIKCESEEQKRRLVLEIVQHRKYQIVIVCKKRDHVADLKDFLKDWNYRVLVLTSRIDQKDRELILRNFKSGNEKLLICTYSNDKIVAPNLLTLVNYDHYFTESKDELDMKEYFKWRKSIKNSRESLFINFVDERYKHVLRKSNTDINIIEEKNLLDLLN